LSGSPALAERFSQCSPGHGQENGADRYRRAGVGGSWRCSIALAPTAVRSPPSADLPQNEQPGSWVASNGDMGGPHDPQSLITYGVPPALDMSRGPGNCRANRIGLLGCGHLESEPTCGLGGCASPHAAKRYWRAPPRPWNLGSHLASNSSGPHSRRRGTRQAGTHDRNASNNNQAA